jgi:hypothetical protein
MAWRSARSIDSGQGLGQEILQTDPGTTLYYIGDESHQSGTSDHNPCDCHSVVCAVDVMKDGGPNLDHLAEHIRQRVLAGDQRTKYLIYDHQIFSGQGQNYPPGQWRPYTGSNPHTDHVHLSVRHGPSLFDDSASWGWGTSGGLAPDNVTTMEVVDVPIFCNLDTGQTLLVMGGVVSIASENDRKELKAALEAAYKGDYGRIAKVGGGTAKQLAGMAGKA